MGLTIGGILAGLGAVVWFKVVVPFEKMLQFSDEVRADELNTSSDRGWNSDTSNSTGESLARLGEALARSARKEQLPVLKPENMTAGAAVGGEPLRH